MSSNSGSVRVIFLALIIFTLLVSVKANSMEDFPSVDFSSHDFLKDGVLEVKGNYAFFWGQLLNNYNVENQDYNLINVPGSWTKQGYNSTGVATYSIRLKINIEHLEGRSISFKFNRAKMSHSVFINGSYLGSKGAPSVSKQNTVHSHSPKIYDIPPHLISSEMLLTVHVANHIYPRGGLDESPKLGLTQDIYQDSTKKILKSSIIFGALLFMALYHLFLFVVRKKDRSTLLFAMFSIVMSLRMLVTEEKFLSILFPEITVSMMMGVDFFTVFFGVPVLHAFIYTLYPKEFHRYFLNLTCVVCLFLTSSVFLTPLMFFASLVPFFEVYVIFIFFHIFYVVIKAIFKKRAGSIIFLTGFICFFIAGINDILFERGYINTGFLLYYGVLFFVFSQSIVLSISFSKAFKESKILNSSLQAKISHNTKSLEESRNRAVKLMVENRALSQKLTSKIESESKIIAKIISKDLGDKLISLQAIIESIISLIRQNSFGGLRAPDLMGRATLLISDIYESARNLSRKLRPESLDAVGLESAIRELVKRNADENKTCDYGVSFSGDFDDLEEMMNISIYRIVEQSLENIKKHSKAKNMFLKFKKESSIFLLIGDDGVGFCPKSVSGLGIQLMRDRVMNLSGKFEIESEDGEGTKILIEVPISCKS